jgi:hypothetical protein
MIAGEKPLRESALAALCGFVLCGALLTAQDEDRPGRPIGKVSTTGDLIVMELDQDALGKANLFDLAGRTLRFTPDGGVYHVETKALQWDVKLGPELSGVDVTLHKFAFPFSGKTWTSFIVGTGAITFAEPQGADESRGRSRGLSIGRFDPLAEAAGALIDKAPAICVFFKPRMSGPHFVKELADRVVITWDLTEPFGNIQDFTWMKTVNRFQAVLHRDGAIEMSYQQLAARDGIVGVYPQIVGPEKALATIDVEQHPTVAAYLDVRKLKIATINNLVVKVTFETAGPVLRPGDPALHDFGYRVFFDSPNPNAQHESVEWAAAGVKWSGRESRYIGFGRGVSRRVELDGNTITLRGVLPASLLNAREISVRGEVTLFGEKEQTVLQISPRPVRIEGLRNPEVHLSSLSPKAGSLPVVYESFHYLALPNPTDLACTVIKTLGDKFDFLAYYSDFRIDNQEAGTPSNGPRGGNVTGIGETEHDLAAYCSQGRFQWGYVQPVYVGSNQMQERPPENVPVGEEHDITFYSHQLGERFTDGWMLPYNYAMSQLGHEMGHRWGVSVSAQVNGETIPLGPVHWARGLHAPVAFPYQRPTEASAMGGGVWQDNFDGTFTQLDDDYYVPATGFSYLDLYLMGLISAAEVPDFFILKNLSPARKDTNGHPIFKADRTKISVNDVIAVEGPRLPDLDHSQRNFNTGMVVIVEHGAKPSPELMERANGIGQRWIDYWTTVTGHRATMTVHPSSPLSQFARRLRLKRK